jgi:hypothetical protein
VQPIRHFDPAPVSGGSIVVIPTPRPDGSPTTVAPSPHIESLGLEPAATKALSADASSLVSIRSDDATPRPAALDALDRHPSAPAHGPSPSSAAGVSGGPSGAGAVGFAALVALLLLGPPILARMLSLSVDLLRPTTLVLQLKRPG